LSLIEPLWLADPIVLLPLVPALPVPDVLPVPVVLPDVVLPPLVLLPVALPAPVVAAPLLLPIPEPPLMPDPFSIVPRTSTRELTHFCRSLCLPPLRMNEEPDPLADWLPRSDWPPAVALPLVPEEPDVEPEVEPLVMLPVLLPLDRLLLPEDPPLIVAFVSI
jgi:hypothetical protein